VEPLPESSDRNWTEPGIYEVSPGVYRIPLPLPNDALRAVNVYAVTDGEKLVLVDSGWALTVARQQLADALGGIGAGLADVSEFLVTHVHRDHYSQAVVLRRDFGSKIALGQDEEPSLKASGNPDRLPMEAQVDLLAQAGAGEVVEALARFDKSFAQLTPSEQNSTLAAIESGTVKTSWPIPPSRFFEMLVNTMFRR